MRRSIRTALILGLLLAITAPEARAYNGKEHEKVSHDALCLALDSLGETRCDLPPKADKSPPPLDGGSCKPLQLTELDKANLHTLLCGSSGSSSSVPGCPAGTAAPASLSYREMVSIVDYVLDPIRLMGRAEGKGGLPRSPNDLDEDFLSRLRDRPTAQLFAAKGDDSHFQEQAMMSWWLWHRQAVLAAAYGDATRQGSSTGNERFFSGLLMNAISNHYLEDSFAPGHIFTPREGLHDFAAMSMHDFYNRQGACFAIEPTRWGELKVLIDPERHSALLGVKKEVLQSIKEKGFPGNKLWLLGDGYLMPSERKANATPGLYENAQRQRIFLTLVVARSIVDVLESYACGAPVNHFEDHAWSPLRGAPGGAEKKYQMASAGFPYGKYEEKLVDRVKYGLISGLEISSQSTVSGGIEDTRGVVSAIVIPTFIWAPPPGMRAKNTYVPTLAIPTLALGLSYRVDDDLPGFGSFVRVSVLSPRLDLNTGLALGVERYTWDSEESYRFHPEIRVGVGVSLVSFFGAVGYDHALDAQRNLQGSVVVRGGVQFALPWSKIPRRHRGRLQCDQPKESAIPPQAH